MNPLLDITDNSFSKEVLQSDLPTIVDFSGTWCASCKPLTMNLEEIVAGYDGRLKVVKINVDNQPMIAGKYRIMTLPSLLFFKDGDLVDHVSGSLSKAKLAKLVAEFMKWYQIGE